MIQSSYRMGTVCAAIAAVTMLVGCGGERGHSVPAGLAARLQHTLDGAVGNPKLKFPGAALYVSEPALGSWSGAAGKAAISPAAPMRPDERFRAGSIMKSFIATVVLQLSEEGKFALDDQLPEVLPAGVVSQVVDGRAITVRMLLNHTSGIPEYSDGRLDRIVLAHPDRVWQPAEFLARAAEKPRPFAPGKGYSYSNTDYTLLGLVIDRATGRSWRAAVRSRIIERLGLKSTTLPEPGHLTDDIAHGYELVNGTLRDATDVDPSMAGAAGGSALVTTTEDLSRFFDALLAGKLFERPATLKAMLTFVDGASESGLRHGYGLGIERYELPGGVAVIGHFGTAPGYRAFVGYAPAQKLDIAIAFNVGHFSPADPTPVIMRALELMLRPAA